MNSRSSVNETNLVNFSTDLSTLNQLDTKDGLLSFPFDHIYACSDSSDRRQTLQLDKEVEISTHCVVAEDNKISTGTSDTIKLKEQLAASENQNKRLKDLLIYHLDLIQQQNELITKREKLYQSLKQENDTLKTKLSKRVTTVSQRHSVNPPPLVHVPSCGLPPPSTLPPVTSTVVKTEPGPSSQIMLNSFTELLLPDNRTNPFVFDSDINKTKSFGQDSFELSRGSEDVASFLQGDLGVPSLLDSNVNCENYTMIENKRSYVKKEIKTEPRSDALYTLTPNSGIQRLQRSRRRTSSGLGSLSRMSKSPSTKVEMPENSKVFDEDNKSFSNSFNVNKKSKINTYGKSRSAITKRTSQFTGSLSDRLQLIDTTPTGEDPYQLGEADMREQSPIPKLMLQKTNHGRLKICSDGLGESTTTTPRRIYDPTGTENKATNKIKIDRYNLPSTYVHPSDIKKETKTVIVEEPDLDIVKTEPEIDWRMYLPNNKPGNETSLCDFSYGENSNNIASHILPSIGTMEFQDLFSPDSPLNLDNLNTVVYDPSNDKHTSDKSKKRGIRTSSLIGSNLLGGEAIDKRISDSKRGRKRALSATGLVKAMKGQNPQKVIIVEPKPKLIKGKAACRGKKSPLPAMVTNKPYHTLVGDPDLSWYLGLDPDVKMEDVDQPVENCKLPSVEVPRWREKPYTSCYTLEGTENLDDKVYEKRHQKLEAEERRQLRWHMRRIREQRHVERLRQRQRDPWGGNNSSFQQPSVFTIWPQPQRDVRFIEITDTLPVMAFGEILPALPESDFVLPWVRTSKALKRSKRSKTLH
ncbi:unnamed protein product [Chilo suppressalis]|uniref:PEHE domain-containing protein n=1 Tax=Chilo suppressalis TaxID=168631 RepID=A0ABN8B7Q6_CHISP|nr:hypothetical protein evm_013038 [Chilo suppressalis]CAH0402027.1 unnamed protein product [Chilo suppressalis]